jgi:hypothetical protein
MRLPGDAHAGFADDAVNILAEGDVKTDESRPPASSSGSR